MRVAGVPCAFRVHRFFQIAVGFCTFQIFCTRKIGPTGILIHLVLNCSLLRNSAMIRYAVTIKGHTMATSNAQRQAAYRARHLASENGQGERLNLIVDLHTKRALERLVACYGVTQRAMIERIVQQAEHAALDAAPDKQADYYAGTLRLPVAE